ncbi:MAG TPA: NTP transferase domain-containing protein [Thermoanaerobaculia bacterium]|nr:NTP transferase domain-containing protein [Thermoanaerobaculia bacterium]
MHVAAVVLAAGASSRMGSAKPLLKAGEETLVARAVRIAAEAGCRPVLAVVHDSAVAIEAEREGARAVFNERWTEGMSTSIAAGIARAAADPNVEAALILACDQVRIAVLDLAGLLRAFELGAFAAAADYGNGAYGIPAVFARSAFPMLEDLVGDAGAKRLLTEHAAEVRLVAMPRAAFDVDRAGDLS